MGNTNHVIVDLAMRKSSGASMNQLHKDYNAFTGENKSFKDFLTKATNEGWFDQAFNGASAILHSRYGTPTGTPAIQDTPCTEGFEKNENGVCVEVKKGAMSGLAIAGISLGILALVGGLIYLSKSKK